LNKATRLAFRLFAAALLLLVCQWPSFAAGEQDPPGRVARISYIQGSVSFRPSGQTDWFEADTNLPLTAGDSIWADKDSRGELHIDSTAIRLSGQTGLSILNIDDRTVQLQLFTGSIEVHLRHSFYGDAFEIDTPNLALALTAGEFRIETHPSGTSTSIAVHRGAAEVTGGGESYDLRDAEMHTFTGSDQLTDTAAPLPRADDFEDWCQLREQTENDSPSARYVSRDIDGYYDLDDSGDWQSDPDYSSVWFPRALPADWVPYHFGRWVFVAPWGWTWIGDEKWGFAPFHYGRWTYIAGHWGWVPGPVVIRPTYAPALVAFVNSRGLGLSTTPGSGSPGVAWFPLGPRDVYIPGYRTSLRYLQNVNVSNTKLITSETVATIYNEPDHGTSKMNYANRQAPGAVTAVSRDTFAAARPVAVTALHVPPQRLRSAPVAVSAAVAPTRSSYVSASAKPTTARPSTVIVEKSVVARLVPPAPADRGRGIVYTNDSPLFNRKHARQDPHVGSPASGKDAQAPSEPNGGEPRLPTGNQNQGGARRPGGTLAAASANRAPASASQRPKGTSREQQPTTLRFTPPVKATEEMYDVHPSAPAASVARP
jgi:hypothetical protein